MTKVFIFVCVAITGVIYAEGHSWVFYPMPRGGITGSDLVLQRYYCPYDTLEKCQPPAKHHISLTEDAMKPCRDFKRSNPVTPVKAGTNLTLHWKGNGHTNSQSWGTCIHVLIAQYSPTLQKQDFTYIDGAECLPYYWTNDAGLAETNAQIRIPDNIGNGDFTILWWWNFEPFFYSSCIDITISGGHGHVPKTSLFRSAQKPEPTSPPIEKVAVPGQFMYNYIGCTRLDFPDEFCKKYIDSSSYCVSWSLDECYRAVCHGDAYSSLISRPCVNTTPLPSYTGGT